MHVICVLGASVICDIRFRSVTAFLEPDPLTTRNNPTNQPTPHVWPIKQKHSAMSEDTLHTNVTVAPNSTTSDSDLKMEVFQECMTEMLGESQPVKVIQIINTATSGYQTLPPACHAEPVADVQKLLEGISGSCYEQPIQSCHQDCVAGMILSFTGDRRCDCKSADQDDQLSSVPAEGNTFKKVCHLITDEGSVTPLASKTEPLEVRGELIDSANDVGSCSVSDMFTGLETLHLLEKTFEQSKGLTNVAVVCCPRQQLDSDGIDTSEVDSTVDFCLESDSDISVELQCTGGPCPCPGPSTPNDSHVTLLTHAKMAWAETYPDVGFPSEEPVHSRVDIGECGSNGDPEKTDDTNVMEQLEVDTSLVDCCDVSQTGEVGVLSEAASTTVAWEVDITELIGKRGKRPRRHVATGETQA